MGFDAAPFVANLYFLYYESDWLCNINKLQYSRTRKLNNAFCFIADLITLNSMDFTLKNSKKGRQCQH